MVALFPLISTFNSEKGLGCVNGTPSGPSPSLRSQRSYCAAAGRPDNPIKKQSRRSILFFIFLLRLHSALLRLVLRVVSNERTSKPARWLTVFIVIILYRIDGFRRKIGRKRGDPKVEELLKDLRI